jgi:hypothetical protein
VSPRLSILLVTFLLSALCFLQSLILNGVRVSERKARVGGPLRNRTKGICRCTNTWVVFSTIFLSHWSPHGGGGASGHKERDERNSFARYIQEWSILF